MSDDLRSKITRRKRAFYIVLESLVKDESISNIIEERTSLIESLTKSLAENGTENEPNSSTKVNATPKKWVIDPSVVELLERVENSRTSLEQKVLENVKSNSLRSIPKPDLAILLVLLTELEDGLDLKVALDQGAKLADDFGGTDSSPKFVHAMLNSAAT